MRTYMSAIVLCEVMKLNILNYVYVNNMVKQHIYYHTYYGIFYYIKYPIICIPNTCKINIIIALITIHIA